MEIYIYTYICIYIYIEAVQFLHTMEVIHADIKTDNWVVRWIAGDGGPGDRGSGGGGQGI
jgi:hypothetical protein